VGAVVERDHVMSDDLGLGETERDERDLDHGEGHWLHYISWAPDDLPANRENFGVPLPNVEKAGAMIGHKKPDGSECWGHVNFDLPELRRFPNSFPADHLWAVESWDPLTISPSVLCKLCNDHGFIRGGRWVRA
jgi:hypothetical protein